MRSLGVAWLSSAALLCGCPPIETAPTEGVIEGVVFKGPVSSAIVRAFPLDDALLRRGELARATSDDEGEFSLDVGSASGRLVVCATGGGYIEEALGTVAQLGQSELCAVVEDFEVGSREAVVLTPWTQLHLALSRCLVAEGRATSSFAVARAQERFEAYLRVGHPEASLFETVPLDVAAAGADELSAEVWLGLSLAALSELARTHALESGLEPGVSVTAAAMTQLR